MFYYSKVKFLISLKGIFIQHLSIAFKVFSPGPAPDTKEYPLSVSGLYSISG